MQLHKLFFKAILYVFEEQIERTVVLYPGSSSCAVKIVRHNIGDIFQLNIIKKLIKILQHTKVGPGQQQQSIWLEFLVAKLLYMSPLKVLYACKVCVSSLRVRFMAC